PLLIKKTKGQVEITMTNRNIPELRLPIQQQLFYTTTEDPSVDETNNQFSSLNFFSINQPQIQVHGAPLENANFVKESNLKKYQPNYQQNFQQNFLSPISPYDVNSNYALTSGDDKEYYSDPQSPFNAAISDDDNGYFSDSQLITSFHSPVPASLISNEVALSQWLQCTPVVSPLSRSCDSEYSIHSQMTDGYSSDLSASPQPQYYVPGINTNDYFAHGSQPLHGQRKHKNVTTACQNCKTSHAKCETQRPCRRCKEKGFQCGSSSPSTPEPTSPVSPMSPSPQGTMQRPF
ncbi:11627_t:CDS:2, partial [Racocetra persica]